MRRRPARLSVPPVSDRIAMAPATVRQHYSTLSRSLHWLTLVLPPLVAPDKAFADQLKEIHETLATTGYFLIGAHALAGLFHHYIAKDDTLRRMLPAAGHRERASGGWGRRPQTPFYK
ncbi:MAG: cytochrome b/b6 domain-containing protein [Acetobacteraceae bacterium]|nr:cytochrome b/b6 domain-containing protein [Acetobacteraceae bacterium]